ncbi:hypothetical protein JCGZ_10884 [Jatropha curcas]|uniref:Uncharacterized protein n=1 Tax=Jatropha curcas TaxID=180498 RepID=A0A067KS92_JATCU|nr:hypothetical protein JCGZ_10884 [Jatropha curcas]
MGAPISHMANGLVDCPHKPIVTYFIPIPHKQGTAISQHRVYRLKIGLRFQNPRKEEIILPLEASPECRRTAAVAAVHDGRKSDFCPEFYNIYTKMIEISWGLPICDQFGLNVPYLTRNSFDSGFATAIHGSSVTQASSPELMEENVNQVMQSQLSPLVACETVVNGVNFTGIAAALLRGRGDQVHAASGPIEAREGWKTDQRLQGSRSPPPLRRMVV